MSAYIMDTISRIGAGLQAKDGDKARDRFWELYENDTAFLSKDLDSAEWLALLLPEEIETLKNLQCTRIRELRAAAFAAEFDGLAAGVMWDGDDDTKAKEKRAEIKNRYPWPGSYRLKDTEIQK